MSKPELIKSSGWFFVAGAFAFITILTGSDPIAIPGSAVSAILLAVGMSNLRKGYGEHIGRLGRNMLTLGMSGPVLWVVAIVFLAATANIIPMGQGLWVLIFVGPAISLLGLTLFGLTALVSKTMSRLNWLPLLAGIWYQLTYVLFSVYDISHKGVFPDQYLPAIVLTVMIQFLTLCILGSVLVDDSSKEMATA